MNICMLVHNNGTRDGRVMREAHTLQAAGHSVTVVGIPESGAMSAEEQLPDGVKVIRVPWNKGHGYLLSAILRLLVFALAAGALAYGAYWFGRQLVALVGAPVATVLLLVISAAGLYVAYRGAKSLLKDVRNTDEEEVLRRRLISSGTDKPVGIIFPAIRSRIPNWIPDWALETAVEPLGWVGAKIPRFSLYRYRSRRIAAVAIGLRPDIVHCHDCAALPTGSMVKAALGIPLIYDAHEIYEAVAARKFGATDYFARVHQQYLRRADGFVAVNDSAANYYRYAYPEAPAAVVIRNATGYVLPGAYDGRLHRAVNLPASEKILLYHGGFSAHRGLETLVRAAPRLPPGWSLVMMGSGPLLEKLKAVALEAPAANAGKAYFLAPVPSAELLSSTQGAAAGIIPYEDKVLNHWIATPNKLWEYPSAGVPMIVQPFPEMRRIVETYDCGWVLPETLSAAAIANLVAGLTDQMIEEARAGCRRFIENDNWDAVYRGRLLALYQELEQRIATQRNMPPGGVAPFRFAG